MFVLKASASRRRVTILDASVNVLCSDDAGVLNAPVRKRTVAISPNGTFKFALGHPAVVIIGRFVTTATASGTIAYSGRAGGGTCSLKGPWSATLVPLLVTERYVGETASGARVTFSVTHPDNNRSSLSVGNFAVGDVTARCSAEGGGGTRTISFEDGSVGRVKNGRFSNGEGAPASSSDEDLAFTASGSQAVHRPLGIAIGDHPPLGGMFSIRTPARTEYTSYGSSEERVLRIGVPDAAAAGST